ncbi:single-stranded-DNA-specific exonuclease RecJ [bacterium]|nr:single-stranded-DNA-specific exonuclease RecJ [bacterium]
MATTSSSTQAAAQPRTMQWHFREVDSAISQQLAAELKIAPIVARILAARGIADPAEAHRFLNPSLAQIHNPNELLGMEKAVERIGRAIRCGEKVWIWGDYDVDGITATAILLLTIEELGCPADYYIPHRVNEGYGLHAQAMEQLAGEGATLIVTVDCGVSAMAEAKLARKLGVDLIITDHHEPGPALPEAYALINPKQPGCHYPCKGLSGSGVAFKLAHALLKAFHPDEARAKEFLKSLLDLVMMGTVADVVPLTGENRCLVAAGLERMRRQPRLGIAKLAEVANLSPRKIDAGSIGFVLGPRLNAAGRTEHALFAVELLLTQDDKRAKELAGKLDQFNENRRAIEAETLAEAMRLIEPYRQDQVLVVAQDGWHHGVLGIVASRIQASFYRPVIAISIDQEMAKGSGRSIPGFDLYEALGKCTEHLEQFGGHRMAAGLSLASDRIDGFREAINAHAREVLSDEILSPGIRIDTVASPAELTRQAVEEIEVLAPFGIDNPKPIIAIDGMRLMEEPRVMKERHMKLWLSAQDGRPMAALGWSMARRIGELSVGGGELRLAGMPILNTWNGRTTVEFEMKDFKQA